ncbi:uncharacterized protein [Aegilops tauschii subsp. strangulata]|uniref:uncharacterized protein isoform X1 n=1 Tax=Aegilops tauschii subsp. strangulata TaxID=200361 RepID=UPI001E1CA59E|nr:uncharacterized protein LOC109755803 [Aegilops tauschii subsp. strangulata]
MKLNGDVPAVLWIGEYLALPLETWASRPCLSQCKGDQLSAEIFNDKDDLKFQSSREDTNIEYFLVAAGRSHLYLINEEKLILRLQKQQNIRDDIQVDISEKSPRILQMGSTWVEHRGSWPEHASVWPGQSLRD